MSKQVYTNYENLLRTCRQERQHDILH